MSRFTEAELEVLMNLIERKSMGALIFAVLHERHDLPKWAHEAKAAGWEPPRGWYKEERKEIHKTAQVLIDRGVLGIGADWDLYRLDAPNEMEIIAEQAS